MSGPLAGLAVWLDRVCDGKPLSTAALDQAIKAGLGAFNFPPTTVTGGDGSNRRRTVWATRALLGGAGYRILAGGGDAWGAAAAAAPASPPPFHAPSHPEPSCALPPLHPAAKELVALEPSACCSAVDAHSLDGYIAFIKNNCLDACEAYRCSPSGGWRGKKRGRGGGGGCPGVSVSRAGSTWGPMPGRRAPLQRTAGPPAWIC